MRIVSIIFGSLIVVANPTVSALTLSELKQADKVRIKTWIEPKEGIITKQQVQLLIEVATDKWFSGGTRFGRFEIEDAIVLQREKFAVNSTRSEDGKSWTVQQWTLVVYPQREGKFFIPSIPVNLSIAGENLEAIVGQLNTRPMSFVAKTPNELRDKDNWVVTTRYEIEVSFDKPVKELKPGDALIRTIHISADDLPAMMLPKVAAEDIPGIAIYQKPPRVSDKVNRGDYLAERIETFTYVFEKSGEYQLPAQTYHWWNLESDSHETIEIPATMLRVSSSSAGADVADDNQEQLLQNKDIDIINLLSKWGPLLVLFIAVMFIGRKLLLTIKNKKVAKPVKLSEKHLQREFNNACRNKDLTNAIRLFYRWLDLYGGDSFQGSVRRRMTEPGQTQTMTEFNMIMRSIYTSDNNNKVDLRQFANKFVSELKQADQPHGLRRWDIELKLN